jgi:hypothetical protein
MRVTSVASSLMCRCPCVHPRSVSRNDEGGQRHTSTALACSKDCGDMMSLAKRRLVAEPLLPELALLSRVD